LPLEMSQGPQEKCTSQKFPQKMPHALAFVLASSLRAPNDTTASIGAQARTARSTEFNAEVIICLLYSQDLAEDAGKRHLNTPVATVNAMLTVVLIDDKS
jgi:hypothetical protein